MKDSIIQQCLDILKRDDIKSEMKIFFKPIIDYILYEINPYITITVSLVVLNFIMIFTFSLFLIMKQIYGFLVLFYAFLLFSL